MAHSRSTGGCREHRGGWFGASIEHRAPIFASRAPLKDIARAEAGYGMGICINTPSTYVRVKGRIYGYRTLGIPFSRMFEILRANGNLPRVCRYILEESAHSLARCMCRYTYRGWYRARDRLRVREPIALKGVTPEEHEVMLGNLRRIRGNPYTRD